MRYRARKGFCRRSAKGYPLGAAALARRPHVDARRCRTRSRTHRRRKGNRYRPQNSRCGPGVPCPQAAIIRQKAHEEKPGRHLRYTRTFCKRDRTRASTRRHQKVHAGQQARQYQTRDARAPASAPSGPHGLSPAVEKSPRQAGHRLSRPQGRHLCQRLFLAPLPTLQPQRT